MPRYIDADALTRRFKRRGCFNKEAFGVMAATIIATAPTADVAPVVHAEWDDYCRCTNCGKEALCDEKPDPYAKGLNALFYVDSDYCPHCGAKMDGGKKENE